MKRTTVLLLALLAGCAKYDEGDRVMPTGAVYWHCGTVKYTWMLVGNVSEKAYTVRWDNGVYETDIERNIEPCNRAQSE